LIYVRQVFVYVTFSLKTALYNLKLATE